MRLLAVTLILLHVASAFADEPRYVTRGLGSPRKWVACVRDVILPAYPGAGHAPVPITLSFPLDPRCNGFPASLYGMLARFIGADDRDVRFEIGRESVITERGRFGMLSHDMEPLTCGEESLHKVSILLGLVAYAALTDQGKYEFSYATYDNAALDAPTFDPVKTLGIVVVDGQSSACGAKADPVVNLRQPGDETDFANPLDLRLGARVFEKSHSSAGVPVTILRIDAGGSAIAAGSP